MDLAVYIRYNKKLPPFNNSALAGRGKKNVVVTCKVLMRISDDFFKNKK